MVHSVELLFDTATDAAVRGIWADLADNGIRSLASHSSPTNRPHVTVTVAQTLDRSVEVAVRPLLDRLPMRCVIGAPILFGAGRAVTVARLVVPTAELIAAHADMHRICLPHLSGSPMPHAAPGHWTPHVTLARRVPVDRLAVAVSLPHLKGDLPGRITGLRHWDGDDRCEYLVGVAE